MLNIIKNIKTTKNSGLNSEIPTLKRGNSDFSGGAKSKEFPLKIKILETTIPIVYGIAFALMVAYYMLSAFKLTHPIVSPLDRGFSVFNPFEIQQSSKPNKRVYGYLPYWKLNTIEYMQLDKITDIAYFALTINADGTIKKFDENGNLDPGYNQWTNNKELKKLIVEAKQRGVNVALTIISHDDEVSDAFLDCSTCWLTAVGEIKRELRINGIKDLSLDFEYVGSPEPDKTEKYTKFIKLVNNELDKEYGNSTVTVATFADSSIRPRITDPEDLAQIADLLFVMAYDFHYPLSKNAGPVAPIQRDPQYTSYDIKTMLRDYKKFIPPNKLVLGVAYYGYNWLVEAPNQYALRLEGNDYIGYSESQTYEGIMNSIISLSPEIQWDEAAKTPFFFYTNDLGYNRAVYFENRDSLNIKYNIVHEEDLAGVGIWALGYDGGYQDLWHLLGVHFQDQNSTRLN